MTIIDAFVLGLLQGLTEFLPVSSSGHLVLGQYLFGISQEGDIAFEVFVHFGTMLSVLVALRREVMGIVGALGETLRRPKDAKAIYRDNEFFRVAVLIAIGCIPAGVVGLLFERQIEELFADPKLVSMMLMVTAFILFCTRFTNPDKTSEVGLWSAIMIGCAQAFAVIPGISRSGSTISMGLFAGVARERAAKFSFLLAVPVIFGASLLKARDLLVSPPGSEKILTLLVGTVVAALSGYVAIMVLLDFLRRRRFSWFAYYCFVVGVLGILYIG